MNFIPNAVSAKVALTALKATKHGPTVAFGAGVVGVVATAVLASRATLKGVQIIEDHKNLREGLEGIEQSEAYTAQDLRKDKALLVLKTSGKLAKIYGPTIAVGVTSIGLLTGSHIVINKRNAGLTAAYAGLDKAYREYRDRVRDNLGVERERDLYRGVETEKQIVVADDGKKKSVDKKVIKDAYSPYAFFYAPEDHRGLRNPNWQDFSQLNVLFLQQLQVQMNNQLQAKGFVFLGDVLQELGISRTKASMQVGWVKDSENGDGFIDFGCFERKDAPRVYDFATGNSDGIWLDFNVDGVILDLI